MLFATIEGRRLVVSGEAAVNETWRNVQISQGIVKDNNTLETLVPVAGDISKIQHVDARGITGAGVSIFTASEDDRRIWGSNQDDTINNNWYGNVTARGQKGHDRLLGGQGDDHLIGGGGNGELSGNIGDDILNGGRGADQIDGGLGFDTMVFSGIRSEYEIEIVDGSYQIAHLRGTRFDGVDTFANIEALQFADQTVGSDDWIF